MSQNGLDFEQPILELEARVHELQQQLRGQATSSSRDDLERELIAVRRECNETTARIYGGLTPWQVVQVSRHKDRPYTKDYLNLAFDEFVELHGDKHYGDDRAMLTGFAKIDQFKVMVVGHQKGRSYKERAACHFGCAHPEGYRKAMRKMRLAEKYGMPIVCFIDTPGAYPGVGAEERGQASVIAESMFQMSQLRTPIICIVIGEGGSGGALGIGVGDRVAVLQFAYYSVISPEGCAGILWKSHQHANKAADALKFTSQHLKDLGVIDDVLEEPLGGAHRDHHKMAARMKSYLLRTLSELRAQPIDELMDCRYEKFRQMGVFLDASQGEPVEM
ncbi:MAG: acetyl-CoA carboxylase carboxyltransferase subunit alpha [Planctomycetales bacterium]|nr:acetyl-CoA carboxylase carboxyltransferase subunit alpha [Planctomycetales bacterium]